MKYSKIVSHEYEFSEAEIKEALIMYYKITPNFCPTSVKLEIDEEDNSAMVTIVKAVDD